MTTASKAISEMLSKLPEEDFEFLGRALYDMGTNRAYTAVVQTFNKMCIAAEDQDAFKIRIIRHWHFESNERIRKERLE